MPSIVDCSLLYPENQLILSPFTLSTTEMPPGIVESMLYLALWNTLASSSVFPSTMSLVLAQKSSKISLDSLLNQVNFSLMTPFDFSARISFTKSSPNSETSFLQISYPHILAPIFNTNPVFNLNNQIISASYLQSQINLSYFFLFRKLYICRLQKFKDVKIYYNNFFKAFAHMDIYDTWKLYKQKIEGQFLVFNEGAKNSDFEQMKKGKQEAKKYYLKFVQLLKLESTSDRIAFKETLDDFASQIKKMGDYIKNNDGKKILANNQGKNEKQEMMNNVSQAIVTEKPNVKWDDVAGLYKAKQALKQAVIMPMRFPQIFTGSRKPWKGILLYGPPGTGKTFIAKACASQMEGCTFFSVSSSDIMSKYVGESEKIVKVLFELARQESSSIIFIDEVDSMAGNRSEGENQSSRRVKTEFLVQMEGVGHESKRLLVLGATNLPWELDPAIRRRFERRIYIPLPEFDSRLALLKKLCSKTPNTVTEEQFRDLAERTQGYSGSDIKVFVKDAVYEPLRISQKANKFRKTKNEKGEPAWTPVPPSENIPGAEYFSGKLNDLTGKLFLPELQYKHFVTSIIKVKPTVDQSQLNMYEEFTKQYGQEG